MTDAPPIRKSEGFAVNQNIALKMARLARRSTARPRVT